jgi:hypothetical protein
MYRHTRFVSAICFSRPIRCENVKNALKIFIYTFPLSLLTNQSFNMHRRLLLSRLYLSSITTKISSKEAWDIPQPHAL